MKKIFKKIDKNILFIFIAALIILIPYLSNKYHIGHDTPYHIATIYGLAQANLWDIFHLKIFGFFANNFGYGAGIFYPQLAHYIPVYLYTVLKVFGESVILSVKVSKFIEIFFSGFFMYKLIKLITKKDQSALVSSLLYMSMPYHLLDVYIRDAMGESYMFPLIPVVFISLYYLLHNDYRKFLIYFVIGCVCLINTHLVLTIYLAIFIILTCIICIKDFLKSKKIIHIIIGVIVTLLLCLPFIIPLLEHKVNGSYAVFIKDYMCNTITLNIHKVALYKLFWPSYTNDLFFTQNIILWLILIFSLFNIKKILNKENKFFYIASLVFIFFSILLMSKYVNWDFIPRFMKMIQFPWRLSLFLGFGLCLMAGLTFDKIKLPGIKSNIIIAVVIFLSIIYALLPVKQLTLTKNYWEKYEYRLKTVDTFKQYGEYLPEKIAIGGLEFYFNRTEEVRIIDGSAEVKDFTNEVPEMSFKVETPGEVTIEVPRIYYLGYEVKATYEDGKEKIIDYYENDNGFIEFKLDQSAQINIDYVGTKYQNIGIIIAYFTLAGSIAYLVISKRKML